MLYALKDERITGKYSAANIAEEIVPDGVKRNNIATKLMCPNLETIVSKAIDRYIELRAAEEAGDASTKIDPRLNSIIEGIFQNCLDDGEHKQVRRHLYCMLLLRKSR